jgi:hypothetical protein
MSICAMTSSTPATRWPNCPRRSASFRCSWWRARSHASRSAAARERARAAPYPLGLDPVTLKNFEHLDGWFRVRVEAQTT